MAIFKAGIDDPTGTVNQGLLYTQTGEATPVMQQANNNRSGKQQGALAGLGGSSVAFKNLDSQIRNLDAAYQALPDKAPWQTYATNILGEWSLCANCQPDYGAKKLFRQYNFDRQLIGSALASAPLDNTEYATIDDMVATLTITAAIPANTITFASNPDAVGDYLVAQLGNVQSNPLGFITVADTLTPQTAGLAFDFAFQVIQLTCGIPNPGETRHAFVQLCCFTPTGAPGFKFLGEFIAQNLI